MQPFDALYLHPIPLYLFRFMVEQPTTMLFVCLTLSTALTARFIWDQWLMLKKSILRLPGVPDEDISLIRKIFPYDAVFLLNPDRPYDAEMFAPMQPPAVVLGLQILYGGDPEILGVALLHEAGHYATRIFSMVSAVAFLSLPVNAALVAAYFSYPLLGHGFMGVLVMLTAVYAAFKLAAKLALPLMLVCNWYREFRADRFAAQRMGYRSFKSGFLKLRRATDISRDWLPHTGRLSFCLRNALDHPPHSLRLLYLRTLAQKGKIPV